MVVAFFAVGGFSFSLSRFSFILYFLMLNIFLLLPIVLHVSPLNCMFNNLPLSYHLDKELKFFDSDAKIYYNHILEGGFWRFF